MKALRLAAVALAALYIITGLIRSFPFQGAQWPFLVVDPLLILAGLMILVMVARGSLGTVLLNPDLLVPIGIYAPIPGFFAWAATLSFLAPLFKPFFNFSWIRVSFAFSAGGLIQFLLNTVWVGWLVSLLLQVLHEQPLDLLKPFRVLGSWFWRAAVVRAIGSLAIYLFLAIGLSIVSLLFRLGVWGGGILTVVILLPAMLAFNAAFAFVVPAAVRRTDFVLKACWSAILFGLRTWRRTIVPLLAFSILVGSIPLVTFTLTSGHQSFNVKFNLFWLADFLPGTGVWEALLAEKRGVAPVPVLSNVLHLFLVAASVVFVLEIYRRADLRRWLSPGDEKAVPPTPPSA